MASIQTDIYRTFLESEVVKEAMNTTKSPLAALTVLKKICDHPFLLSDKMANCSELTEVLQTTQDRSIQNTLRCSNKMFVLLQLLKQLIHDKHRILVFSQYKIILTMIEPILKGNNICYIRMDGDTKYDERQKFVDYFNENKNGNLSVFLLSTKVGGLGLNLTGSDRVIIYDPAWNPAIDAQAVDRSYRIGQVRDVMVYRFVTCGTIEEKIYRRQISKVGLLKSITNNTNQMRYFSKNDLREIFKFENPECSQTQIQFKELHQMRVGTNAMFDRETMFVEQIMNVYGISHHDLLFRTCPQEELEENPELAQQIEAIRKKLKPQEPTPRNRRIRKVVVSGKKLKKIQEVLSNTTDISNIIDSKNKKKELFRFRFDRNDNGENENKNNNKNDMDSTSNSMDIDDDIDAFKGDEPAFISNISLIETIERENSNSWTENMNIQGIMNRNNKMNQTQHQNDNKNIAMSTEKKTRKLNKKKKRFIADSDSDNDDLNDSNNVFSVRRKNINIKLNHFEFMSAKKIDRKQINKNIIFQTPLLRQYEDKNKNKNNIKKFNENIKNINDDPEDEEIDIKDVMKVIRTQPRRKRKKSMANLQTLIDAVDEKKEKEYDSEATQSECDEHEILKNEQNIDHEQGSNAQIQQNEIWKTAEKINNISFHQNKSNVSHSNQNMPPSDYTNNNISFQRKNNNEIEPKQSSNNNTMEILLGLDQSSNNKSFHQKENEFENHSNLNRNNNIVQNVSCSDSTNNKNVSFQNPSNQSSEILSFHQNQSNVSHSNQFGNISDLNRSKNLLQSINNKNISFQNNNNNQFPFNAPNIIQTNNNSNPFLSNLNRNISRNDIKNDFIFSSNASIANLSAIRPLERNQNNININNAQSKSQSIDDLSFNGTNQKNPYLDSHFMQQLKPFSPAQNEQFVAAHSVNQNLHKMQSENNSFYKSNTSQSPQNNLSHSNMNGDNYDNTKPFEGNQNGQDEDEETDEETVSDHEMLDLSTKTSVQNSPKKQSVSNSVIAQNQNSNSWKLETNPSSNNQSFHRNEGQIGNVPSSNNQSFHQNQSQFENRPDLNQSESNLANNNISFQNKNNNEFHQSPNQQRSESVTVQQIFDNSKIMEKKLSMEPNHDTSSPLNICIEKRKELSTNFKRYRRKSMLPQFEELDNIDDEEEDEETEHEQEGQDINIINNNALSIKVCDEHRKKAMNVESFEYSCTKCHCFCTESELLRYSELLQMADKAEREENHGEALKFLMEALEISNQDIAIHQRCMTIGYLMYSEQQ